MLHSLPQIEDTDYDAEGGSLRIKGVCVSQNRFVTVSALVVSLGCVRALTPLHTDGLVPFN